MGPALELRKGGCREINEKISDYNPWGSCHAPDTQQELGEAEGQAEKDPVDMTGAEGLPQEEGVCLGRCRDTAVPRHPL